MGQTAPAEAPLRAGFFSQQQTDAPGSSAPSAAEAAQGQPEALFQPPETPSEAPQAGTSMGDEVLQAIADDDMLGDVDTGEAQGAPSSAGMQTAWTVLTRCSMAGMATMYACQ